MRVYALLIVGPLKIENGVRFFWWTYHCDAKTNGRKCRWYTWDRVTLSDIIQKGKTFCLSWFS